MDLCKHVYYALSLWLGIMCMIAVFGNADSEIVTGYQPSEESKNNTVLFPGVLQTTPVQSSTSTKTRDKLTRQNRNAVSSSEIPVSLFLNKQVKNVDDFMMNFVKDKDKTSSGFLIYNKNSTTLLRSSSTNIFNELASMAACMPEPTTVELEESADPAYIYFPPCTKIDRCGGCCSHPRLSCQPTVIEHVDVKMLMMKFEPESDSFVPAGVKIQSLEKHSSCECKCSVKEEHCTEKQHYLPNECRCKCNNEEDIDTCIQPNKFWDPVGCSCTCRHIQDCSTGFYFDSEICTCKRDHHTNLVFRVTNDRLPQFGDERYEIVESKQTSKQPPKPAFRGKRNLN